MSGARGAKDSPPFAWVRVRPRDTLLLGDDAVRPRPHQVSGESAYRASTCKAALEGLAQFDPAAAERVFEAAAEPVSVIREAGRLAWVEASVFDDFNLACLAELGEERYVELWHAHALSQIDSPTFGKLFSGAIRVFGITPKGLFKVLGQAWTLTTKGYGKVSTAVEDDCRVRVSFLGLPEHGRLRTVVLSMQGSLGAGNLKRVRALVMQRWNFAEPSPW